MAAPDKHTIIARVFKETDNGEENGLLFSDHSTCWFPGHELGPVRDGVCVVRERSSSRFGVLDQHGNVLMECRYAAISDYSEGRAFLLDNTTKLIDTGGTIVKDFGHELVANDFHDGLAIVSEIDNDSRAQMKTDGYVDRRGNFVIPLSYRNPILDAGVHTTDDWFSEGMIRVRIGRKAGYINRRNAFVIEPVFDEAGRFSEGLAWVRRSEFVGFIDRNANAIIPHIFESAGAFSDGLAPVKYDGLWGYIDRTGKVVVRPAYLSAGPFHHGRATVVTKDGERELYHYSLRGERATGNVASSASSDRIDKN